MILYSTLLTWINAIQKKLIKYGLVPFDFNWKLKSSLKPLLRNTKMAAVEVKILHKFQLFTEIPISCQNQK